MKMLREMLHPLLQQMFTRNSAMAEGPRDALVSIEKLAIDERP